MRLTVKRNKRFGEHEGSKKISICAEYMKPWVIHPSSDSEGELSSDLMQAGRECISDRFVSVKQTLVNAGDRRENPGELANRARRWESRV